MGKFYWKSINQLKTPWPIVSPRGRGVRPYTNRVFTKKKAPATVPHVGSSRGSEFRSKSRYNLYLKIENCWESSFCGTTRQKTRPVEIGKYLCDNEFIALIYTLYIGHIIHLYTCEPTYHTLFYGLSSELFGTPSSNTPHSCICRTF